MNRPILLAVAAVAVLVVAGFGLVLVTEQPVAPAVLPPPPVAAPVAEPVPVAPPAHVPTAAPAPAEPAPASPEPAPPPAWAAKERIVSLEPMRKEIFTALTALDDRVRACGLARPQIILALESQEGRVRVLEARVPTRQPGELPEGVTEPEERPEAVSCVKGVLEGAVLDSPSARPGRRWDMAYAPGAMR